MGDKWVGHSQEVVAKRPGRFDEKYCQEIFYCTKGNERKKRKTRT